MNTDESTFYNILDDAREHCGGAWGTDTMLNILGKLNVAYRFLQDTPIRNSKLYIPLIKKCANILYNRQNHELESKIEADKILCEILDEVRGI